MEVGECGGSNGGGECGGEEEAEEVTWVVESNMSSCRTVSFVNVQHLTRQHYYHN